MKEVIERAIDTLTGADPLSLYRKDQPKARSDRQRTVLPAGPKVSARKAGAVPDPSAASRLNWRDVTGDQQPASVGWWPASWPLSGTASRASNRRASSAPIIDLPPGC